MEEDSYRNLLQTLEIKAQEQYDKTVLMLSAGALGISFSFIKDIVKLENATSINYLIFSWVSWMLSVLFVLVSFYFSRLAMSKAIEDYDNNDEPKGNKYDWLTTLTNALSGLLFLFGLLSIIIFLTKNLG